MTNVDVVVIGAGPAGLAAAITLVRAGREVVVIDKATFPRDKICGDGLTTNALRQYERLGALVPSVGSYRPVARAVVRAPKGRELVLDFPDGRGTYAAVATRRDLDAALVDAAIAQGVDVRQGHPLAAVTHTPQGVRVSAADLDLLDARFAVAADGMWSPTRKLLGEAVADYRGEWHAFRQYFANVSPRAADELYVSFETDLLPGYFWSFPLADGRANVGFGIRRGGRYSIQDMKALWIDLLARPHLRDVLGVDATPLDTHRAWPIPARIDTMSASSRRVLFAGDAIAACDMLTGEGIGQALDTGQLAAEAILANWSTPDRAGESYRAAIDAGMSHDHRMAARLGDLMAHRKGVEFPVWLAGRTEWTRRNFARWLFEAYPRSLLTTPRRWRRGAMTVPGAFE